MSKDDVKPFNIPFGPDLSILSLNFLVYALDPNYGC